jgi:EmrB/QacA subfamily drug resistance transporter
MEQTGLEGAPGAEPAIEAEVAVEAGGSSGIEPQVMRIAIVVIAGLIMSVLDTTIVNVALNDLSRDLHASLASIQWVITGYLLSLAAVIPVTGWAVRRFSARRLYLVALVVFTAGSALCGLATSSGELIAFRVLQGVGGGMLTPIGQMILVKAAGPRNLPKVMSFIGVPIVLAPIFGPTLGGLLLQDVGWQWIFVINVPIGIIALTLALRLLPHDAAGTAEAGRLDVVGLVLAAAGTVGITYGLSQSESAGSLTAASVLIPAIAGLVLVGLFVLHARRVEHPLLDLKLFANRAFGAASLVTFCLGAALFGSMILLPLYFQLVRGEDAITTGLLLIPQGVGAGLAMALSGRLTERLGGGRTSLIGGMILTVATVPFLLIGAATPFWVICAAMLVRGFGVGMSIMPAMTAAFSVLAPEQINDASPQLTVLQRVGGSLGTAIIAVVLEGHLKHAGHASGALAASFAGTYWWVMGVTVAALAPTLLLMRIERRTRAAPAAHRGHPTGAPLPEAA